MSGIIKRLEELRVYLVTSQVTRLEAAQILEPLIKELREKEASEVSPSVQT